MEYSPNFSLIEEQFVCILMIQLPTFTFTANTGNLFCGSGSDTSKDGECYDAVNGKTGQDSGENCYCSKDLCNGGRSGLQAAAAGLVVAMAMTAKYLA